MNQICDDFNGTTWIREGDCYYKIRGDEKIGKIYGRFLVDPEVMWEKKCEQYGVDKGSKEVFVNGATVWLKPSNAVYSLWADWSTQ